MHRVDIWVTLLGRMDISDLAAPLGRDEAHAMALFDSPRAWRMTAAAFVAMFASYGIAYSFGAFFKPMTAEFGAARSQTAVVFSLTVFVWSMSGSLAGHLADRYGPRVVVSVGAVVMAIGLISTGYIHQLWIGYLTYSLGVGTGIATSYVPMIAVVGGWFLKRRNSALGIAVAGIGCGTVTVAPLAAALINRFGWRTTDVAFGLVGASILLGCAAVIERPPVHVVPSQIRIREAIRTPAFGLLYLNSFLSSLALFVPFVYLPAFAHDHGVSEVASATLVGVIGGASVAGRLGLGALADRFGVMFLLKVCYLVLTISFAIWLVGNSYPVLIIFALVLGAGYGGFVALSPAVIAELFGIGRLGTMMGLLYTSGGVGALLGPPLAGIIIDRSGSYRWAIVYSLVGALASWVVLLPLKDKPPAEPVG
ncbi:MAG TPA: MFS transporter [Candidatus Binataceae bacterium]|nr:MFS transporter [Candidatus Binataceae bacterium]